MDTYKLKDMYKLKFTRLQNEIFRLLCIKAGMSLNQRGVARMLRVSPTAIAKSVQGMEKEGFVNVKKSETMNLLSIELNRDSKRAIELKRVENLKMVYESGLSDFLFDEFPGCAIILFGSYSRGEDVWTGENEENRSDIDIAIIGSKEKNIELTRFDKILERAILINFYPSFKEIHKNLKDNILNGIILTGGVEL